MSALMKPGLVRIGGREETEHWTQTGEQTAAFLSGVRCMKLAFNLTVKGFN